jgi:tyrosine-protein kinase
MPEFTGHRDLRAYLRIVWRWRLLIVVIVIAAPAIAYLSERGKPSIYESSVLVSVPQGGSDSSITDNINAVAALVNTTPVANIAGDQMTPKVPGSSIVGDVSASPNETNGLLTITATTTSPVRAAAIANAFSQALGISLHDQLSSQTQSEIATLKAQLKHLPRGSAEAQALQQEILQDRGQLKTESSGAQILQAATPDDTPVGPHLRRTVELGFVIGLLVAFAVVLLLESADRRLRAPDDLESLTGLPLLAAIGPSAFSGTLETTAVDEEAFQMLRTALTYFTVGGSLKSVLITSPGEKEGKSTVSGRLALAAAHAGLDVILVDADLRRAGATEQFGLRDRPGLGITLAERRPLDTVLVDWPLREGDPGRLRVLPAGPPPPNPAALVSSDDMRSLLVALESQTDLVIVDSPAALAVSDAVPLMQAVSGVVLIARMNHSKRDTIHRLQKMIVAAHGKLLGIVATGVTAGPGYEKYSQEYYAAPQDHKRRRRRENKAADDFLAPAAPYADGQSPQNGRADDIAALKIVPHGGTGPADRPD